jgi:hypothetical protein
MASLGCAVVASFVVLLSVSWYSAERASERGNLVFRFWREHARQRFGSGALCVPWNGGRHGSGGIGSGSTSMVARKAGRHRPTCVPIPKRRLGACFTASPGAISSISIRLKASQDAATATCGSRPRTMTAFPFALSPISRMAMRSMASANTAVSATRRSSAGAPECRCVKAPLKPVQRSTSASRLVMRKVRHHPIQPVGQGLRLLRCHRLERRDFQLIAFDSDVFELHRIRHYGLFANGNRAANIARARELLAVPSRARQAETSQTAAADEPCVLPRQCRCCGGRMIVIETFARGCQPKHRRGPPPAAIRIDTS